MSNNEIEKGLPAQRWRYARAAGTSDVEVSRDSGCSSFRSQLRSRPGHLTSQDSHSSRLRLCRPRRLREGEDMACTALLARASKTETFPEGHQAWAPE